MQTLYVFSLTKRSAIQAFSVFSLAFFAAFFAPNFLTAQTKWTVPSQDWLSQSSVATKSSEAISAISARLAASNVPLAEQQLLTVQSQFLSSVQSQVAAGTAVGAALEKGLAQTIQFLDTNVAYKGFDRAQIEPLLEAAVELFSRTDAVPAVPKN